MSCFFLSCNSKEEKTKPIIQDISESVYASGTLKSEQQYKAFANASGIVNKLFAKEGDTLKKGDIILSIVNRTQQLSEENAAITAKLADAGANQGKLNEAQLAVELSKSKMRNDSSLYFRQQNLWQQQVGTKVDLEQRELAYQSAKSNYYAALVRYKDLKRELNATSAQAKNSLAISKTLAGNFILRSEIDGILYDLPIAAGEAVNPQTPLAVVGSAEKFILEMQVDEYDILKVKKGLLVFVSMDSYKGKVFEAVVSRINPIMNERSKTFVVEAQFKEQPAVLYPNISFEANIVIQRKKNALLIPRTYLLNNSKVINGKGDTITVVTGLKDYQRVEVISGLSKDDELIKPAQ